MSPEKHICYTLDLEHDYAGITQNELYETLERGDLLDRFAEIVQRFDIKLTIFITGRFLVSQRQWLEFFENLGAEFEMHGHNHVMFSPDFKNEVNKGLEMYQNVFGHKPKGYRSPGGVVDHHLYQLLVNEGIQYDSSLIPSYRIGTYNNINKSPYPHKLHPFDLFELPIGVIPKVRLMVSASYIKLLGFPFYKLLFKIFGVTSPLVYLFHLVDIIPVNGRSQLSRFYRFAYGIREKRGMDIFESTVSWFKSRGYQSIYMSTLHEKYSGEASKTPRE